MGGKRQPGAFVCASVCGVGFPGLRGDDGRPFGEGTRARGEAGWRRTRLVSKVQLLDDRDEGEKCVARAARHLAMGRGKRARRLDGIIARLPGEATQARRRERARGQGRRGDLGMRNRGRGVIAHGDRVDGTHQG